MTYSTLLTERDDAVLTISLNRPQKANAISHELAKELKDIAVYCRDERSIRCVVLTGYGKFFCAGGDISEFGDDRVKTDKLLLDIATTFHEARVILSQMGKPLITLVNGPAAGAGMGLALSGDLVYCSPEAHFTPNYSAIGLTPDSGLTWLLPRCIGWRKALEVIYTNQRILGTDAEKMGLVNRCVNAEILMETGLDIAKNLTKTAIGALAKTRQLFIEGQTGSLEEQFAREALSISEAGIKPEGQEGMQAFLQKRTPDYEGI